MSKPIEQALLSLIPAHGTELPPPLLELAGSLLAQSRNRAGTLKADEEVARYYACANLACERLKIALDLPPIEPRPPIPPRIYKRLYTHLDNILPNPAATPRASRKRNAAASGLSPATKSRPLPSRATPSREGALSQFRTPSKPEQQTPTKLSARMRDALPSPAPTLYPWVQPVARFLCAETGHGKFAPSVLAGIEFVLATAKGDAWVSKHATGLVAAILFHVIMGVRATDSVDAIADRKSYVPLRKTILARLGQAKAHVKPHEADASDFWLGWETLKSRDFDAAVAHVNDRDWVAGDWYKGIVDVAAAQAATFDSADQADGELGQDVPTRRADMMLQDKYDLLSETRRSEYRLWRDDMLSKINQSLTIGTSKS